MPLTYFNAQSFSPRYGDHYFTVTIVEASVVENNSFENCNVFCAKAHGIYKIRVSRGRKSWIVHRRYKEFLKLSQDTEGIIDKSLSEALPKPPRRTLFPNIKYEFLCARKVQLHLYLDSLLFALSKNKLMTTRAAEPVLDFLGFYDFNSDICRPT